jgi:hypothetical protein
MKGGIFAAILWVVLIVAGVVGEIKCIYKFFTSDFQPSYKRECIYGFSSIIGAGAIVGYIDVPDEPVPAQPTTVAPVK